VEIKLSKKRHVITNCSKGAAGVVIRMGKLIVKAWTWEDAGVRRPLLIELPAAAYHVATGENRRARVMESSRPRSGHEAAMCPFFRQGSGRANVICGCRDPWAVFFPDREKQILINSPLFNASSTSRGQTPSCQ
jgi:hypothetical protein